MKIQKEIKHLRGLAQVLNTLADEVGKRDRFTDGDLELLKELGSDVLFKGVTLNFLRERGK